LYIVFLDGNKIPLSITAQWDGLLQTIPCLTCCSYTGWPTGVGRFSKKKKVLGRFSSWTGFIFTKL